MRTTAEFLRLLAPHIVVGLQPPAALREFTTNPDVLGAYVEAAVRQLVRSHVEPLRVATGAVIDQSNRPRDAHLPQLDTIVWTPSPVPAIFQAAEFGLVPRSSSLGTLEIKSSAYDPKTLDASLDSDRVASTTADKMDAEKEYWRLPALGVICVRTAKQSEARIDRMKHRESVVVLFDETRGEFKPRPREILRLVNFLSFLRLRGRVHQGLVGINLDALGRDD